MYSYDRKLAAGLNGELTITGGNISGKIGFRKYLEMPPSFDGAYLDQATTKLGQGGLERIMKAAWREMEGKPPNISIKKGYAGMDRGKFFVAAEATWKPSRDNDGEALAAAIEAVSRREGVTVQNWLD